jgi:hypothetical protein
MGFLGYIGWQQKTLIERWDYDKWQKLHLWLTILAVVLVTLHAILDGSDFAWLRS